MTLDARDPASIDAALDSAGLPPLPRTAWASIDLDRLADNLRAIRASVPAGVRVEPVVKADAYGHGLIPVARGLRAAGADGLSVAGLDEALALRRAGVTGPILVLYPIPPDLAGLAARRQVGLTIGDPTLLERTLAAIVRERATGRLPRLAVQIELETGLGRGGLTIDELADALSAIRGNPAVRLTGVWSHLAAPADPGRSRRQVERFEAGLGRIGRTPALARHLAASGALVGGAAPSYEAVRPGLATYGIVPEDIGNGVGGPGGLAAAIRPVLSLHARPVRVADLPAGHGVSYGPTFTTSRASRIATLPLGYGDGWPRSLSNRAEALVRGQRVPLVGTVAMDAVMADVTDVPGRPVTVDDTFTLIGEQGTERITATDLARSRTTISWEVVTSIAGRVPRVYHAAAAAVGVRTLADERYP